MASTSTHFRSSALDVVVVAGGVAGHVLQLGERLDAGVAAADEDEGEGRVADRGVAGGGGDVHLLEDVVAQADGLLDGLEADAVLGEAGDGEGAGDRAGRDDEFVVRAARSAPVPSSAVARVVTVAVRLAWSMAVASPMTTWHWSSTRRSGTTTWRGEMEPAAASGRKG